MIPPKDSLLRPVGGSFRDPLGRLYTYNGKTIRIVKSEGAPDLAAFLSTGTARVFTRSGNLASTRVLDRSEIGSLVCEGGIAEGMGSLGMVVEHDTVPFQSFPYEWPFEMLKAAGQLTLDLAESCLKEGFGIKDATPYNILFRGPQPIFIDLLSFEKRHPKDPIWLACGQFERTFIIPLLVCSRLDAPPGMLLAAKRDGLYPKDAYGYFGVLRRLLPPILSCITLPAWLESRGSRSGTDSYKKRLVDSPEKASYVLGLLFRRLRRTVTRIPAPKGKASNWSDYATARESYSEEQLVEKQKFIEEALLEFQPRRILDVGCNTGHFSAMAAQSGASVVAVDADSAVVGNLWTRAKAEKLDILPLVINLARPSSASGWRNREWPSFLDRARDHFDAILMLALVHHLLVTERIPLQEILELTADLTRDIAIVEFVSPDDPMFMSLASTNLHLYRGLTKEAFDAACLQYFRILRCLRLSSSNRWIYLLRKDNAYKH